MSLERHLNYRAPIPCKAIRYRLRLSLLRHSRRGVVPPFDILREKTRHLLFVRPFCLSWVNC